MIKLISIVCNILKKWVSLAKKCDGHYHVLQHASLYPIFKII